MHTCWIPASPFSMHHSQTRLLRSGFQNQTSERLQRTSYCLVHKPVDHSRISAPHPPITLTPCPRFQLPPCWKLELGNYTVSTSKMPSPRGPPPALARHFCSPVPRLCSTPGSIMIPGFTASSKRKMHLVLRPPPRPVHTGRRPI